MLCLTVLSSCFKNKIISFISFMIDEASGGAYEM